uniref:Uncharacterized protein n=1 Tax=Trypanosoma vivax (strain Y486) TaxID=1055687 RepID=G0U9C2_TRYVY|nr:hypothetical protein TVY486_1116910 [Trypanosoma vivax Y486]
MKLRVAKRAICLLYELVGPACRHRANASTKYLVARYAQCAADGSFLPAFFDMALPPSPYICIYVWYVPLTTSRVNSFRFISSGLQIPTLLLLVLFPSPNRSWQGSVTWTRCLRVSLYTIISKHTARRTLQLRK